MADIIDISALLKQFKDTAELEAYCNKQYGVIVSLQQKLKQAEEKIVHLETVLEKTQNLLPEDKKDLKFYVSKEEAILDTQINFLSTKYVNAEMPLEDLKRLDILIRSKKVFRDTTKNDVETKKSTIKDASLKDLIQLASQPTKKEEDDGEDIQ